MAKNFETPFVFGVRVEGDNFTDRKEETERLLEEKMERWEYLNELAEAIEAQNTR